VEKSDLDFCLRLRLSETDLPATITAITVEEMNITGYISCGYYLHNGRIASLYFYLKNVIKLIITEKLSIQLDNFSRVTHRERKY